MPSDDLMYGAEHNTATESNSPNPVGSPPTVSKKRWGCGTWLLVALGVVALGFGILFCMGLMVALSGSQGFEVAVGDEPRPQLIEHVIQGRGPDKILLLPITGLIADMPRKGILRDGNGLVSTVRDSLKLARMDDNIKGVVLLVDSPGGGITASDVLHHEVMMFREDTGLPVITIMGDVAASGGYYVAAASDCIMAHPTTVTGSIGVIMPLIGVRGLLDKIGVEPRPVKSGKNKDIGSAYRDISPEELQMLQAMVDEYHRRFVSVVYEGFQRRGLDLSLSELENRCDGRVFTGEQALELGFVDHLGYFDDAIEEICRRSGLSAKDARVITFQSKPTVFDLIMARAAAPRADALTLRIEGVTHNNTPRFLYLWTVGQPGMSSPITP